jgi:eukaryotic-like serine/threonine-protein kinase
MGIHLAYERKQMKLRSPVCLYFYGQAGVLQGAVLVVILKKLLLSNGLLCVFLTVAIGAGSMGDIVPLQILEGRFLDRMLTLRQGSEAAPVAVVAIDSASLAEIGEWPWPRNRLADMIEHLTAAGARSIGFYPLFSDREHNRGLAEIRNLRQQLTVATFPDAAAMDEWLQRAEQRSDNDSSLISALQLAPRPVLPLRLTSLETEGSGNYSSPLLHGNSISWTSSPYPWQSALRVLANPLEGKKTAVAASSVVLSSPELTKNVSTIGHINQIPDPDGRVRFERLFIRLGDRLYPSFGLQMAATWHGAPVSEWQLKDGEDGLISIYINSLELSVDRGFRLPIDFDRTGKAFDRHSYLAVMDGSVAAEAFSGKAVLVGLTAGDSAPMHATSLGMEQSGVEITAHVLASLLSPNQLSRPGWAFSLELFFLLQIGLFLAVILPRVRLFPGIVLLMIFLTIWFLAAATLLSTKGIWIKTATPTFLVLLGFGVVTIRRALIKDPGSYEDLKMLGLSFQGQGMLDMALEKFRKCPVSDPAVRELLYNLGLDFERKRMFNKAAAVYAHLLRGGKFRDARKRMIDLESRDKTIVLGGAGGPDESQLRHSGTRPTLGRYEIIRELGQGAMGIVYLGRDPTIHREVAIKTLPYGSFEPDLLDEVKSRFFREAEAAGRLNHPNIVTIHDAGEEHDMAYLAMELLDGTDLTPYCRKENLLPVRQVLEIAAQIADALEYAHLREVVHRDIKPANIMRLSNGAIKVTDFGIARVMSASHTQTGMLMGTPSYMSPEQVAGKKVDGRSDLFSLGVVVYELLSGTRPFQGESLAALMFNITNARYPSLRSVAPGVPPCCADMVEKLLAKGVSHRFGSAAEAAKSLRLCLNEME